MVEATIGITGKMQTNFWVEQNRFAQVRTKVKKGKKKIRKEGRRGNEEYGLKEERESKKKERNLEAW